MKQSGLLTALVLMTMFAAAQYNTWYQHYYTPVPVMEVVYGTCYLSTGSPVVRSSTATDMHLSEYNRAGTYLNATNFTFTNGASLSGMDILNTDDIALAVSDVLCADRGVTTIKPSKKFPNGLVDTKSDLITIVSPNPCRDKLHIAGDLTISSATVYNFLGQQVSVTALGNNTYDVSSLTAGIYKIVLHTDKGMQHATVLKK